MENLKKWFNFNNTISGSTFVGRWLIASIVQFVGGWSLGWGLANSGWQSGYVMLGFILASIGIVLQFSTLSKRSKALFESPKSSYFYFTYLALSIAQGFTRTAEPIFTVLISLAVVVMFLYAIFKNSGVPEVSHEG